MLTMATVIVIVVICIIGTWAHDPGSWYNRVSRRSMADSDYKLDIKPFEADERLKLDPFNTRQFPFKRDVEGHDVPYRDSSDEGSDESGHKRRKETWPSFGGRKKHGSDESNDSSREKQGKETWNRGKHGSDESGDDSRKEVWPAFGGRRKHGSDESNESSGEKHGKEKTPTSGGRRRHGSDESNESSGEKHGREKTPTSGGRRGHGSDESNESSGEKHVKDKGLISGEEPQESSKPKHVPENWPTFGGQKHEPNEPKESSKPKYVPESWPTFGGQQHISEEPHGVGQQHVPEEFHDVGQRHILEEFHDVGQQHIPEEFHDVGQQHIPEEFHDVGQQHIPEEFHDVGQQHIPEDFHGVGQHDIPEDSYSIGQQHIPEEFHDVGQQHVPEEFYDVGQQHVPIHFPDDDHHDQGPAEEDQSRDQSQQHMTVVFPPEETGQEHTEEEEYIDEGQAYVPVDWRTPADQTPIKTQNFTKPSTFRGGCPGRPPVPVNAALKCSLYSGCRASCLRGYQFPSGELHLYITCENQEWQVKGSQWRTLPPCQPICLPSCQNNGICIAPNQCNCPDNYGGAQCQFEKKPCLEFPALPANSKRVCTSISCTITCAPGYEFPDGSSITNMMCKSGEWLPTRPDWVTVPDCRPTCEPNCMNGGVCLAHNVCQCPQQYRGPQCQYDSTRCSVDKLKFNGIYNCSGNSEKYSCSITCPPGVYLETTPAEAYTCYYSTGVFEPQPVPQCVYGDNVDVIPIEVSSHSYYKPGHIKVETSHTKPGADVDILSLFDDTHPAPGTCRSWNGRHYKTFDGSVFSLESSCTYRMLEDKFGNTFKIDLAPSHCHDGICHRPIHIYYQDQHYKLFTEDNLPVLLINGVGHKIPYNSPTLIATVENNYLLVQLLVGEVQVKWDAYEYFDIEIDENNWNNTLGLCGDRNGVMKDDWVTKQGYIVSNLIEFVDSWKVEDEAGSCVTVPVTDQHQQTNDISDTCDALRQSQFVECQKVLETKPYIEACTADFNRCKKCACQTVKAMVKECQNSGNSSLENWRTITSCGMVCHGGREYQTCGPDYEQTCRVQDKPVTVKQTKFCVDGCFCPDGTVLHEHKCIPKHQCPCQLRGKMFQHGDKIPKGCNTCSCEEGKWICTEENCGSRCSSIGDPHYVTFDGRRFDFMGQCSYYLLKSNNYSVEAENVVCEGSISEGMNYQRISNELPSCTKSVTIRFEKDLLQLKLNRQVFYNHVEVSQLPTTLGNFLIRDVSSIFMMVTLSNGIDIWWDGLARVYLDAPAELQGETKGLCGTFNFNQKDDFLTPENDIEHSVTAFANKWKTEEKCSDVQPKITDHPCETNMGNKQRAESYCRKLKSDLYKSCHWYVDVETYYKDCLFDVCSCNKKFSSCLCPILAEYASECARQGVLIEWRSQIRECGVHCTGGQVYQTCGDSCTRSCQDISLSSSNCRRQCVEGCNCPGTLTLDQHGECIPVTRCPCLHKGLEYSPGHNLVVEDYKGPQFCTCERAKWSCRDATANETNLYSELTELKAKCAAEHKVFTECEPEEQRSCKNMHVSHKHTNHQACTPGCVCKKGHVLDYDSHSCIKPTQCPCHHGGVSYSDGQSVQNDCNTCTCHEGKWNCTDRVCPGICSVWGDTHFKTFDGRIYDFQGSCYFVLAKGHISDFEEFEVIVQVVPCGSSGISCLKSLTFKVSVGGHAEEVTFTKGKRIPEHGVTGSLLLREAGLFVYAESYELGVVVQWDKQTRVYVKVEPKWRNKVKGLCGNFNDNEADDWETPTGGMTESAVTLFADSWSLQTYCPASLSIKDTCVIHPERRTWAIKKCTVLKSHVFEPCHSEVLLDPYIERCITDTCGCDEGGDCECLCSAIAAYAHECSIKGVAIQWRTPELCPMQCDTSCSEYISCIPSCPVLTCDNQYVHTRLTHMCAQDACVEGCKPKPCPEGEIFMNAKSNECVPQISCRTVCLQLDNVTYYEGDLMEEDSCHTCTCSRHKKICVGQPCPTTLVTTTLSPVTELKDSRPVCHSGWSTWINQRHPTKSKVWSDREPLPDVDVFLAHGSKSICQPTQMTNIRCRSSEFGLEHKMTGEDVECSLEKGLLCVATNRSCLDYEISVFCDCGDVTTTTVAPTTKPPAFTLNIPTLSCNTGWTPWINSHYPNTTGEFELLNEIRTMSSVCPDWAIVETECRAIGDVQNARPKCTKQGLSCVHPKSGFCPDFEVRYQCDCQCTDSLHVETQKVTAKSGDGNEAVINGEHGWRPLVNATSEQWIQVEFEKIETVTGVELQGDPSYPHWVTSFTVSHSNDGQVWSLILDSLNQFQILKGNQDQHTITKVYLEKNITARFVRIRPLSHHGGIGLRFQLLGCHQKIPEETKDSVQVCNKPHQEHPTDCHLFLHCVETKTGPVLVEKSCGGNMLYNPRTQICDWPAEVEAFKPQCKKIVFTTPTPARCVEGWTEWYNTSHPAGDGDYETIENIRTAGVPLCEHRVDIQCKFYKKSFGKKGIKTGTTSFIEYKHSNDQDVECSLERGLICDNSKQDDGQCEDYSVRFKCQCHEETTQATTTVDNRCGPHEVWDDCAFKCDHLCDYWAHVLYNGGNCQTPDSCYAGCRPIDWKPCSSNKWMLDSGNCVDQKDCLCQSHKGHHVQPGVIFKESECELCQCVNNQYECDSSSCVINVTTSTTTLTTAQGYNHAGVTLPTLIEGAQGDVIIIPKSTVTPVPGKCPQDKLHSLMTNLATLSTATEDDLVNGIWKASNNNLDQYLQVDLGAVRPVFGVTVFPHGGSSYVTSYHLLFSVDGVSFSYVMDENNLLQIYRGNADHHSPVTQMLPYPIEARYVRFNPRTWHGGIVMSVDVLTCGEEPRIITGHVTTAEPSVCKDSLLTPFIFQHNLVQVSSSQPHTGPNMLELTSEGAWQPLINSKNEWVTIDLLEERIVSGFKTKGMPESNDLHNIRPESWTKTFTVHYSHDGKSWNPVQDDTGMEKVFLGNFDSDTTSPIYLERPIRARYFKIVPTQWYNNIALKLDILGCYEPYSTTPTLPTPPTTLPSVEICNICQGASLLDDMSSCPCSELWWDGENCVNNTNCPCFIGHISYPIGTTFEQEDCQQCTCRLYGLTHCEPKLCPPCSADLQSTLTTTCNCICSPCPDGTRLCPTSNVCVKSTSWCDGVSDCPDDEVNCTSTEIPPTCPVPTCPPDHKLVVKKSERLENTPEGIKTKHVKTKPRPEKIICPEYECVLDIHEKTCPIQTCPPKFKAVVTENVTSENSCPVFTCNPVEPKSSVCTLSSRVFKTFDGVTYKYDICDHVLVKDELLEDWRVSVAKLCTSHSSCTVVMWIVAKQHRLRFSSNLTVELDGYEYTFDQLEVLNQKQPKEFFVNKVGDTIIFYSKIHHFEVMYDRQGNVRVEIPNTMKNQVAGLCGNYNNRQEDDRMAPDGRVVDSTVEFGDSWRSPHAPHCEAKVCPLHLQTIAWKVCNAIRHDPFKTCSDIVEPNQFVAKCLESVCTCLESGTDDNDCRCQALLNYVTECKRVNYNKDLSAWRILHDCPAICPADLVHHDCYSSTCEPTCENPTCTKLPSSFCFPGCYCPEGLVRSGDRCVKISECRGCTCNSLGDTQFLNYDRTIFNVNGNCTYVATRDVPPNGIPNFQVLMQNGRCRYRKEGVCTVAVLVYIKGHSVSVRTVEDENINQVEVKADGKLIQQDQFPYIEEWLHVEFVPGKEVSVYIQSFNLEVVYYYLTRVFSVTLPYHVYHDRLEGLCGNCNKDETDDLVDEHKIPVESMEEFGKAWTVHTPGYEYCGVHKQECSNQDYDPIICERILMSPLFEQCHPLVDPARYIQACQSVTCYNGSLCNSIEAYARSCNEVGLCINWRDVNPSCSLACPEGLVYQHCVKGCPATCENHEQNNVESCSFKPREGCFCPDGKIYHNQTCIDPKFCSPCDDQGHYEDDTWSVDLCTSCSCTNRTTHCTTTECSSSDNICEENYIAVIVNDTGSHCCPKYICAPAPIEKPNCPELQVVECGHGQHRKMEVESLGCYQYVCRCKPPEECDSIRFPDDIEFLPGMVRVLNKTGCCPKVEVVCQPETCPQPEVCQQFYEAKVETRPAHCCPTYTCEKPDKCIHVMEYTNDEVGGERPRHRKDKDIVLKEVGSQWQDGPCRTCSCYNNGAEGATVTCTIRDCPTIETHPDRHDYMLKTKWGRDRCCHEFERTACKYNKKVYEVEESWYPVVENRCETMICAVGPHGVVKETRVDTCNTNCDLGWKYIKQDEECCGHCVQAGCVIDNVVNEGGHIWFSDDNCTTYTCAHTAGTFQIVSSSEQCPNLEHCPLENVYDDGCCRKCNLTASSKKLCALEELQPEATLYLVKEYQNDHGKCMNLEPIHHFTECIGTCQSRTFYNPENWSHGTSCQCCQIESFKALDVPLTCSDGEVIHKRITIPAACNCLACGG